MTWLRRRSSSPEDGLLHREAIREQTDGDIYPGTRPISRPPQTPVQRENAVSGYHRPADRDMRSTGSLKPSSAIPIPSARDAAKLRAAIIWRETLHWLTGEQTATALGLSAADFERKVAAGELGLVSKIGPGDQRLYQRDAVRGMILAGG